MPMRTAPLALALVLPGLGHAADLVVPSEAFPTLSAAFRVARPGDVVRVQPDVAVDPVPLDVPDGVTIQGLGGVAPLPPLRVGGDARVTLVDVRFARPAVPPLPTADPCAAAALCVKGGEVLADGVVFVGATVVGRDATLRFTRGAFTGAPGVALDVDGGALTLDDVRVSDGVEGGVRAHDARIEVRSSHFADNGGRPGVDLRVVGGRLDVDATTFERGTETSIDVTDAPVRVSDGVFRGVRATRGAAVAVRSTLPTSVTLEALSVEDLATTGDGGAVWLSGTTAVLVGVEVTSVHAGGRGGWLYAEASIVAVDGARSRETSADRHGGAIAGHESVGELTDVSITGATAAGDGGAIHWDLGSLSATRFTSTTTSATRGGAIGAVDALVRLTDVELFASDAERGAVHLSGLVDAHLVRPRVCDAVAVGAAALDATGLYGSVTVENGVFLATSSEGGATLAADGLDLALRNNIFAGNDAPTGVVWARRADVELLHNVVTGSSLGADIDDVAPTGGYNAWFGVDVVATGATGAAVPAPTDLDVAPGFSDRWTDGCAARLYLAADSPLRDAGDPARTDADGTRADIGAYGGPGAHIPDTDADGVGVDLDCDDTLATVFPGAAELPYDGVDQDCDGADVCDVDGDGVDAMSCGGGDCDDTDGAVHPGRSDSPYDGVDDDCDGTDATDVDQDGWDAIVAFGGDCDDGDPAVHPDAEDVANDGVDQDCDGEDRRVFLVGGGGCDHGAAPSGLGVVAALAALRRRRARRD